MVIFSVQLTSCLLSTNQLINNFFFAIAILLNSLIVFFYFLCTEFAQNFRKKFVLLSNHRIIRFRVSADPLSTDWDCYKTELVSGFGDWGGDILTEDDTENSVNVLQSKIIAAFEKACPLRRTRLNHIILEL
jgi:hypothetical protein